MFWGEHCNRPANDLARVIVQIFGSLKVADLFLGFFFDFCCEDWNGYDYVGE